MYSEYALERSELVGASELTHQFDTVESLYFSSFEVRTLGVSEKLRVSMINHALICSDVRIRAFDPHQQDKTH